MKFNLTQKEIQHIIAKFIQDSGLNPGNSFPRVELIQVKKDVEAIIDVAIDITKPMGDIGLTVLSGKPVMELEGFDDEEEEEEEPEVVEAPKPKATRKKRVAAAAVVKESAPVVETGTEIEEEEEVQEEEPAEELSGNSLFGGAEGGGLFGDGDTPGVVEELEEEDTLGSDTLFAVAEA